MPRIPSKKTQRFRIIEAGVSVGMSGTKIQKLLKANGLGVRNKILYSEIRVIKGTTVSEEKREKSIPKKYKKKAPKKWKKKGLSSGKTGMIYRGSLIISSVPLHSKPFNRHYLGFRLNIFSYSKKEVYSAINNLKRMFLRKVGDRVRSFEYAREQTLGTENPTKIYVKNPDSLNDKWFYAVEENGKDISSEDGNI